ncbi:unnamed protein product [Brassicogethes aeneus]|uniref:Homeobox domain-containing protein n=1 Tax=Brassicogethes aeneus TaxID=1431903 RepID=A0A9P0FJA1_BRAAE|nr:unnamed protein product [Brassicogethes aeneus]
MENNLKSLNLNDTYISPSLSMPNLDCDKVLYELEYCGERIKIKSVSEKNRKGEEPNDSDKDKRCSFSEDVLVIDEDYVEPEQKIVISPQKNVGKTQHTNFSIDSLLGNTHKENKPASFGKESLNQGPIKVKSAPEKQPNNKITDQQKENKKQDTKLTLNQLQVLHQEFNKCAYPSKETRVKLSKILNVKEEIIKTWFQKRRYIYMKHVKKPIVPTTTPRLPIPVQHQQILRSIPPRPIMRQPFGLRSFPFITAQYGLPQMSPQQFVQVEAYNAATNWLRRFQNVFSPYMHNGNVVFGQKVRLPTPEISPVPPVSQYKF